MKSNQKPGDHPQFQEKRSRSEQAILGALGEFQGVLGAALGIPNSILGIRSSILGMASHDLSKMKTTILGATPGAIPRIDGSAHERLHVPMHSRSFFSKVGVVPACQKKGGSTRRDQRMKQALLILKEAMKNLNQNPPDWGQSRRIRFSKFPGSELEII